MARKKKETAREREERVHQVAASLDAREVETLQAHIEEDPSRPGVDAPSRYMEDEGVFLPGGYVTEFGEEVYDQVAYSDNPESTKKRRKRKAKKRKEERKYRDWIAYQASLRTSAGETPGFSGPSKAERSKTGARRKATKKAIQEQMNPEAKKLKAKLLR